MHLSRAHAKKCKQTLFSYCQPITKSNNTQDLLSFTVFQLTVFFLQITDAVQFMDNTVLVKVYFICLDSFIDSIKYEGSNFVSK